MLRVAGALSTKRRFALVAVGLLLSLAGTACEKETVPPSYSGPITICNDGWISHSTGSGTCSWHDGVRQYVRR